MQKHNQNYSGGRQQKDVFGLATLRAFISGPIKTALGERIAIVPFERLNDDGHITAEFDDDVLGQELWVHPHQRNAVVKAEPRGGREFIVLFDKDEDGDAQLPKVTGQEIMVFTRLFTKATNPKAVQDRCAVLSWCTLEAYAKAKEEVDVQNKSLPHLADAIAAEERTLWTMYSEATGIDISWATPAKIKELLARVNRACVPTDAVWSKRDPEVSKKLANAMASQPRDQKLVTSLMEELRNGVPVESRPKQLMMMRTGDFAQRGRATTENISGPSRDVSVGTAFEVAEVAVDVNNIVEMPQAGVVDNAKAGRRGRQRKPTTEPAQAAG